MLTHKIDFSNLFASKQRMDIPKGLEVWMDQGSIGSASIDNDKDLDIDND